MKTLILNLLFLSSIAHAGPEHLKMKFYGMLNTKVFSLTWDQASQKGVLSLALTWIQFDPQYAHGFLLTKAGGIEVLQPLKPEDCVLSDLQGAIVGKAIMPSPIKFTASGASCQNWLQLFRKQNLVIQFSDVPHKEGGGLTESLLVESVDLP